MKKVDKSSSAGTKDESSTNAQDSQVSQPIAKPNVSSIDFWVECNVCKQRYKNLTGSTPCCGSIAWIIENGQPTIRIPLFASINFGPIQTITIEAND